MNNKIKVLPDVAPSDRTNENQNPDNLSNISSRNSFPVLDDNLKIESDQESLQLDNLAKFGKDFKQDNTLALKLLSARDKNKVKKIFENR